MEGTTNSLDTPLYDALFPGLSVIPKGSCIDVQRAVSGLRGSQDLHHVEAFGLIDRDDRPDEEIDQLAEDRVFALDVCSAEALYYCSDAIAAVARRQAESLGCNADELIRSATRKALDVLIQNGLAKQMAARRGERRLRTAILSTVPGWKEIMATASPKISACVESPYLNELTEFKKLVADGKLDDLVARYPLRKSNTLDIIAKALKCQNRRDYERMVIFRIREDGDLAQKLKERIAALSCALDAETMVSKNSGS